MRDFFAPQKYAIRTQEANEMGMLARALKDHLKEVGWALFFILACLYVILGREIGYDTMMWVCIGFAVIVLSFFIMIILGELLWVGFLKRILRRER